jgi:hypothetical protein
VFFVCACANKKPLDVATQSIVQKRDNRPGGPVQSPEKQEIKNAFLIRFPAEGSPSDKNDNLFVVWKHLKNIRKLPNPVIC